VDYTVFTDAHKRKIRAHYAALVMQIDHEVGEILAALEEKGLRERTVIIFSSDHGNYLGDHNLIGKGSFYEARAHVPQIAQNGYGIDPSGDGVGRGGESGEDGRSRQHALVERAVWDAGAAAGVSAAVRGRWKGIELRDRAN